MKYLSLLLVILVTALGCGKNNQTGKSGSSIVNPGIGNAISTGNQQALLATVMNESRCINGMQRITIPPIPLNMNVAVGGFYVGVTSEGDVAVVTSNNGQGVFSGYVCARQSLPSGQGQLLGNPVINRSYSCGVDEITAAKMSLGGALLLNFRAIQFGQGSSLCRR